MDEYPGYFSDCIYEIMFFGPSNPFFANRTLTLLLAETKRRLSRLNYLYDAVHSAEDDVGLFGSAWKKEIENGVTDTPNQKSMDEAMFRAEIFAESFYVFAFRVIEIIRYLNNAIAKKQKILSEPKGIIRVRNHLIIHPQAYNRLSWSLLISTSDGRGICLKNKIGPGENPDPVDAGFRANAAEFKEFMHQWAAAVRAHLKLKPPPKKRVTTSVGTNAF